MDWMPARISGARDPCMTAGTPPATPLPAHTSPGRKLCVTALRQFCQVRAVHRGRLGLARSAARWNHRYFANASALSRAPILRHSRRPSSCRKMMLTIEELASIPIFSKLPVVELEHLAKRAADMQLAAGEYAVHEGEERALFAVIAGKIEVTKRIDGIERTIGWRTPGKIFGEVPLALGGRSSAAIARRNPRASFEWMRSS